MAHERAHAGVVHRVRQIAHEDTLDAPARHLADGEGAPEDAHVGVHAHDEQVLDPSLAQAVVDLRATGRDPVSRAGSSCRRLTSFHWPLPGDVSTRDLMFSFKFTAFSFADPAPDAIATQMAAVKHRKISTITTGGIR